VVGMEQGEALMPSDAYRAELTERFVTDTARYVNDYMALEAGLLRIIEDRTLTADEARHVAIQATQSADPRGGS
jgi:hypothetical protein